jgi:hypothetical protein
MAYLIPTLHPPAHGPCIPRKRGNAGPTGPAGFEGNTIAYAGRSLISPFTVNPPGSNVIFNINTLQNLSFTTDSNIILPTGGTYWISFVTYFTGSITPGLGEADFSLYANGVSIAQFTSSIKQALPLSCKGETYYTTTDDTTLTLRANNALLTGLGAYLIVIQLS